MKKAKSSTWHKEVDALCHERMLDLINYLVRLPCRYYTPENLGGHGGACGHLLDPDAYMHLLEFFYLLEKSTLARRGRGRPKLTDKERSALADEIVIAMLSAPGTSTKSVIEQVAKQRAEKGGRPRSPDDDDDGFEAARMHIQRTMGSTRKRR